MISYILILQCSILGGRQGRKILILLDIQESDVVRCASDVD
jgi:hypothetical protein